MVGDDYRDTRDGKVWTLLIDRAVHAGVRSVCLTLSSGNVVVNKWVPWAEFVEHYERIT